MASCKAYNAQAAVDATAQVIVAHHLSNNAADQDALAPLLDALTANTGATPAEVSADNGYCSEANLADLGRRGIRGYVATGRAKHPDGGEAQRRGPWSRPCASGSDAPAGAVATDCASRSSNPSSGRSREREGFGNSSSAASRR